MIKAANRIGKLLVRLLILWIVDALALTAAALVLPGMSPCAAPGMGRHPGRAGNAQLNRCLPNFQQLPAATITTIGPYDPSKFAPSQVGEFADCI